jgi:SNF2 family DNA or RNA helicase
VKKWLDSSRYYCPLDKVSKSLAFILDMGWKIYDHRHRQVLRQKTDDIESSVEGPHVLVRGKVQYERYSADLKSVVGAFNRKERFIDLSSDAVGLLEEGGKWEGLSEHEIVADAIAIKRERVGLLEDLFAHSAQHDYAELFRSLPKGWQMAAGEVSSSFQGELFGYQREGVKWLEFLREGRCGGLLADEMGLGKTVQVVAFFSQLQISKPCLIVVPTSLLFNWKREFERFLPSCPVHVFAGEAPASPQIVLTTYAVLRLQADLFQSIDFQVIVLDEAQAIKNPDTKTAQIAFSLKGEMRVAITGTPIENRLQDLFSLFHFLLPGLLGSRSDFQATLIASGSDARYLQQVKRKLRPFLLRRKKEAVLQDLPAKMEQIVWVDMTEAQRNLYDQWVHRTKAGLIQKVSLDGMGAHRMEILEAILRLRQLCVHPFLVEKQEDGEFFHWSGKAERLIQDLQEAVEEGKKVLVYSQFTTMLHLIRREVANKGWSFVYLDGSTADREAAVQQFQEDPSVSIFLISLKAGGVGLNLTAADYVFLFDPWWNEAVEQQAIDRAHRLGRKETVIARRYVTALSIEEKIMHLKKHKLSLAQGLFEESGDLSSLSLDDLMNLLLD